MCFGILKPFLPETKEQKIHIAQLLNIMEKITSRSKSKRTIDTDELCGFQRTKSAEEGSNRTSKHI